MFKRFNELYRSFLILWFFCGVVMTGLFFFLVAKGNPSLEVPAVRGLWFCLFMGVSACFLIVVQLYILLQKPQKQFASIMDGNSRLYKSSYANLLDVPLKVRGLIIISEIQLAGCVFSCFLMVYLTMTGVLHALLAADVRFFYPYVALAVLELIFGTPRMSRIEKRMESWIRYVESHNTDVTDSSWSYSKD